MLELSDLAKAYGTSAVLHGLNLTIATGEFFSLLGPSGCGKTTTLRLIGGFETVDRGSIHLDGVDITNLAPERRPVNTVFQNYALFPHKSVADNVAFGLRFAGVRGDEIGRRVGEALELVRMSEFAKRRPHQLSGGQQQRVALARSLVLRPKVLLLDEPLGALDAKLRRALQDELRAVHRDVGITFVYVTHDQEEALTMSDRIAVMRAGEIVQLGSPATLYDEPATTYVADFLGVANVIDVDATSPWTLQLGEATLAADCGATRGACVAVVRPERLRVVDLDTGSFTGTVTSVTFAGPVVHVDIAYAGRVIRVTEVHDGRARAAVGDVVGVEVPAVAVRVITDDR